MTTIMEGKIEGKAGRGKQELCLWNISLDIGIGRTVYEELKVVERDRD